MDRTVKPFGRGRAARHLLACAAASALLITGCSSGSGGEPDDGEPPAASPTPEPVRFTDLPNACRTVDAETVEKVVPEASDDKGEELPSENVAVTSTCLWSGLDGYDFRSLTVTLKRFDSDLSLGSGDSRAGQYLESQTAEITEDEANEKVKEAELAELGDESVSIGFTAEKKNGDSSREFRQHRVVTRSANVVVTVDYAGTGFESADLPSADDVRKGAEVVASEVLAAVDATADAEGDGATDDGGNGDAGDGEDGATEEDDEQDA